MPPVIRKMIILSISTLAMWSGVGMVYATEIEHLDTLAVILAFIGTMALWLVFGLEEMNNKSQPKANTAAHEKAKRDSASGEDPRLALMLSLMTPNERDALKARLADEMGADGESIPLADFLSENGTHHDHIATQGQM